MIQRDIYRLNKLDQKLDQNFTDNLLFDIFLAHEIVLENPVSEKLADILWAEFCKEYIQHDEKDKGQIEAIVGSVVQEAGYNPELQNYLWIASAILNKLANKHALFDGNKRTALESAMQILSDGLGMNFEWDSNEEKYVEFILQVVRNWKTISEEEQIEFIEEFLDNEVKNQMDNI